MAKKRLRYIEDLYDFYSNKYKRSTKFSAEKTGEPLVVQVHGRINFDESDKNKDGLLPVHLLRSLMFPECTDLRTHQIFLYS